MIKALFRKQFAELIAQIFRDKRTGKRRSKVGGYVLIVILVLSYVGMAASFYFVADTLLKMISPEMSFLYYFVMGLIAVAIGLLGSVFNAYSTIFQAKDNELLLSMPIPPRYIVFTRVVSLAAFAAVYEGVILIPAFIARLVEKPVTALVVVNYLLLYLFVTMFVVALTLALAFVVAAIARKVKRKSLVTVVTSLALLALYYYLYYTAQSKIAELAQMTTVPESIKGGLFLFYYMGLAAEGDAAGMAIFAAISAALFALAYFLLSFFFIRFNIHVKSGVGKVRKEKAKAASPRLALFRRELKHYLSLPVYILNASFGTLFMLIVGVGVYIKADMLQTVFGTVAAMFPNMNGAVFGATVVLLMAAMNYITAPSVSLEGNRMWIVRSLPIKATELFRAKIELHLAITLLPALFATSALVYALRPGAFVSVMMFVTVGAFVFFTACLGLALNLLKPSLEWKSEIYAVKSGVAVFIATMGNMFLVLVLGALYLFLSKYMSDGYYLIALAVLFAGGSAALVKWIGGRGVKRFEALS